MTIPPSGQHSSNSKALSRSEPYKLPKNHPNSHPHAHRTPAPKHRTLRFSGPSQATLLPATLPRRIPGLSPGDHRLAVWYIANRPRQIIEAHCHVPVGTATYPVDLQDDDDAMAQLQANWPKRIDLVINDAHGWHLVECKVQADHRTIGQLLGYLFWWKEIPELEPPTSATIVTNATDPDVERLATSLGIALLTMPEQ